jgi:hypothetical protein
MGYLDNKSLNKYDKDLKNRKKKIYGYVLLFIDW